MNTSTALDIAIDTLSRAMADGRCAYDDEDADNALEFLKRFEKLLSYDSYSTLESLDDIEHILCPRTREDY